MEFKVGVPYLTAVTANLHAASSVYVILKSASTVADAAANVGGVNSGVANDAVKLMSSQPKLS